MSFRSVICQPQPLTVSAVTFLDADYKTMTPEELGKHVRVMETYAHYVHSHTLMWIQERERT